MQEITSLAQFTALKSKPLLVVDFFAHWCGPCKAISPVFERLAEKHKSSTSIVFAKVNVDVAKDVSQTCGITAMPTFQFYSKGNKVDEIRGADVQGLTRKIETHVAAVAKLTASNGTKLGESKSFQGAKPISTGEGSLRALIDLEACKTINASSRSSIKSILRPSFAGVSLDSASNSALLVHIPMTQAVNMTSVRLSVPAGEYQHAPSKLWIGTNIASPKDMNSLATAENVQSFTLYSDEYVNGTAELKLKTLKFQKIKSVTILFDINISGDVNTITKVTQIDLFGSKA